MLSSAASNLPEAINKAAILIAEPEKNRGARLNG